MTDNDNGGGGFLLGLLIGGIGGFVAGMVFAPKSGEEKSPMKYLAVSSLYGLMSACVNVILASGN